MKPLFDTAGIAESEYPLTKHTAAATPPTKPFLLPAPVWDDDWAGLVLGEDATHRWMLLEFGFNLRLITVPHGERNGWDYGWCYPRDTAAVLAALEGYDPDTQNEPMGWHKRPGAAVRKAPRWEERPEYNRPRCRHGAYLAEKCRDRFCPDFRVDPQGNGHQAHQAHDHGKC